MIEYVFEEYWHYGLIALVFCVSIFMYGLKVGMSWFIVIMLLATILVFGEFYSEIYFYPYGKWVVLAFVCLIGIANHIYLYKYKKRFPCPCCGYLTLDDEPPGTFEICSVCYWEDDDTQFADSDSRDGANDESLNEARENYKTIGACSPEWVKHVRRPRRNELPRTSAT